MKSRKIRKLNYFLKSYNALKILLSLFLLFILLLNFQVIDISNNIKLLSNKTPIKTKTCYYWLSDSDEFNFTWYDFVVQIDDLDMLGELLEGAYDYLVGDWDFPDIMQPGETSWGASKPPIRVRLMDTPFGNPAQALPCDEFPDDYFWLRFYMGSLVNFDENDKGLQTCSHEVLHLCQFQHPGIMPELWVLEGQAQLLEDMVSDTADHLIYDNSDYLERVDNYLKLNHMYPFLNMLYDACLFWKYFCEQFGSHTTDPDYGIDALATFWDTNVNPISTDGITMINNAINALAPGSGINFENLFVDFSIANWAKGFDDPSIPDKWKYIDDDEVDGSGDYGFVYNRSIYYGNRTNVESPDWSSRYYQTPLYTPNTPVWSVVSVDIAQNTSNQLYYTFIGINKTDNSKLFSYTTKSRDISRSFCPSVENGLLGIIITAAENEIENPAVYNVTVKREEPVLEILNPKENLYYNVAEVGPCNSPNKFFATVNVSGSETGLSVFGFEKNNFRAYVNSTAASVSNLAQLNDGTYVLEIDAPVMPENDTYNLTIELTNGVCNLTSDISPNSVKYGDVYYDRIIVIDKSLSMLLNNKITSAKSAAQLFIDGLLDHNQAAIVEYNESANLLFELSKLTPVNRSAAISAIDSISIGGVTSIGDGLLTAQNELFLKGLSESYKEIIILSDGKENIPPWISDIESIIVGNNTIVHTISIGIDSDTAKMQDLAFSTGGTYNFAFDPSSGDIPNDLANIYRSISEFSNKLQRIYEERDEILPGYPHKWANFNLNESVDMIEITVHYNGTDTNPSLYLFGPDWTPYAPLREYDNGLGMGYKFYRINNPALGTWKLNMTIGGSDTMKYLFEAAVKSSKTLNILSPSIGVNLKDMNFDNKIGDPLQILVSFADNQPVLNAYVTASLRTPSYKKNGTEFTIPLYDDGAHGDNLKGDGIYGSLITCTSENGSYTLGINATGISNEIKRDPDILSRLITTSFYITDENSLDTDSDGLPNVWELYYGLNEKNSSGENGENGDPDKDDLINKEELFMGTNPLDSDSDKGGQNDGSEIKMGYNPLDPSDDDIERFPHVRIYPGNEHIYFIFPNKTHQVPDYNQIKIYRSIYPVFGYSLIHQGLYNETFNDTGLINQQKYYYRFVAVKGNETTGLTRQYEAIPKVNVIAPEVIIKINNNSRETNSSNVIIDFTIASRDILDHIASPIGMKMRITNNLTNIINLPWIDFMNRSSWTLEGGEGYRTVYTQFKDSDGNISPISSDTILVKTSETSEVGVSGAIAIVIINIFVIAFFFYRKKKIPKKYLGV